MCLDAADWPRDKRVAALAVEIVVTAVVMRSVRCKRAGRLWEVRGGDTVPGRWR